LLKLKLSEDDVYDSFKEFYSKHSNAVDLLRDKTGKNFREWGKKEYLKIANNPQYAFLSSAKDYFYKDAENYCFKGRTCRIFGEETS
jgi:hypothetical protein